MTGDMRFRVEFASSENTFSPAFGAFVNVSDGGYEKGYAQGHAEGYEQGYGNGQAEGYVHGHEAGYAEGVESRYPIEDSLLDKTLTAYSNDRPVTIGNRFFSYCYNLEEVNLPNCVGTKEYAFVYCTKLPKLVLPSAEELGVYCFQSCSKLAWVDLTAARNLPSNIFTNTAISTLILRRTDQITTNGSTAVFNNTPMSRGEGWIYVPRALLADYQAASNWTTYADQFRALEDYTVDGTTTGDLDESKI